MARDHDVHTAAGFLEDRRDFLNVRVVPSDGDDRGWDVIVRVDGTYFDRSLADEAADGIRQMIAGIRDVPAAGGHWWAGPPWKDDLETVVVGQA